MKTTTKPKARSRAEILTEMASLPHSVQGKISSYRSVTSSGRTIVYHNLQWWADGKNHSMHIPSAKVAEIEEAIKNGKRLWELATELSLADASEILSSPSPLKKTSRVSSSRARRGSTRS